MQGSINCIREHVDYVIIVYQNISNFGTPYSPAVFDLTGVDLLHCYEPDLRKGGAWNETQKRNLGLQFARLKKCTHFICLDCDEYYEPNVFSEIKQAVIGSGADASAGRMFTYYKYPTDRLTPLEGYYVPLIHKIDERTVLGASKYPVYADPTRRVSPALNFLKIDKPVMHHFSYVRKDIMRKVNNSSARVNLQKVRDFEKEWNLYEITGKMPVFLSFSIQKVDNLFDILII